MCHLVRGLLSITKFHGIMDLWIKTDVTELEFELHNLKMYLHSVY